MYMYIPAGVVGPNASHDPMAGSSTDPFDEPIVGEDNAGEEYMATTVISFNFGIVQQMLGVSPWRLMHRINFLELLRLFRDDHEADMIFGCEIGSHREGPGEYHRQSVSQDLDNMTTVFCQNYMSAVRENAGVKTVKQPFATSVGVDGAGDPQLMLCAFQKVTDVK